MKVIVTGAGALVGGVILRSPRGVTPEVEMEAADRGPVAAGLYSA